MLQKLTKYEGEGNNIPMSFKVNDELLRYIQQAVLDLSYQNNGLYFRDLIYAHATKGIPEEYLRNTQGIPKEYPQEYHDNQGIPVNQTTHTESLGIPVETLVKQVELPQLTDNSNNELLQLRQLIDNSNNELSQLKQLIDNSNNELSQLKDNSNNELSQLRQLKDNSNNELSQLKDNSNNELLQLRQLKDNSNNELSQLKDNSKFDMSQVEIEDSFVPEGISTTQYRMYVRRLEDENVKLDSALKICHNALEAKQQEGNLSAMMYQSELAIHQVLSWVQYHFQQFFPQGDVRQILTEDVRKFHPNFPYFKMPNPLPSDNI